MNLAQALLALGRVQGGFQFIVTGDGSGGIRITLTVAKGNIAYHGPSLYEAINLAGCYVSANAIATLVDGDELTDTVDRMLDMLKAKS
jgi:hypothetical protein